MNGTGGVQLPMKRNGVIESSMFSHKIIFNSGPLIHILSLQTWQNHVVGTLNSFLKVCVIRKVHVNRY